MNPWLQIGMGLTLIIMTIALRRLSTPDVDQLERLVENQRWLRSREVNNADRRTMILLSSTVIAISLLTTPMPFGRHIWPHILTIFIAAGVISYWLHQSRTVLEIFVPEMERGDD